MIVNELYERRKNTSAILFWMLGTFPLLLPSPSRSLAFLAGSSVGNATSLALLRHSLAFTRIRRAGQRTSTSHQPSPSDFAVCTKRYYEPWAEEFCLDYNYSVCNLWVFLFKWCFLNRPISKFTQNLLIHTWDGNLPAFAGIPAFWWSPWSFSRFV